MEPREAIGHRRPQPSAQTPRLSDFPFAPEEGRSSWFTPLIGQPKSKLYPARLVTFLSHQPAGRTRVSPQLHDQYRSRALASPPVEAAEPGRLRGPRPGSFNAPARVEHEQPRQMQLPPGRLPRIRRDRGVHEVRGVVGALHTRPRRAGDSPRVPLTGPTRPLQIRCYFKSRAPRGALPAPGRRRIAPDRLVSGRIANLT